MRRLLVFVSAGLLGVGVVAAVSAATPVNPKPTMRQLVYGGMAKDVVGREKVATPNGERDAQFAVMLSTGKRIVLQHVVLQRVFAKGGYAEGWDTNPGTSASILAVYLDGRRLNNVDRDLSASLAPGSHRLVVYANDHYGVFAPGQLFRVTAAFPDFVTASATTKLAGSPPALTATFTGLGEDIVGQGTDQKPNGQADAHFVVTLDTHGAWQIIDDVTLRHLTPTGALDVPIYHMQGPQTAGLKVNGARVVWPTAMPWWISVYVPVNPKTSPVKLELYANDPTPKDEPSAWFGPGQQYRLTVHFTDSGLMPETFTVLHL